MNQTLIVLGALAFTLTLAGAALCGDSIEWLPPHSAISKEDEVDDDHSSLEQDLHEVLSLLPLTEIRAVVENYARHDKQIVNTIEFFNDEGKFIFQALRKVAHVQLYLFILKECKLDTDKRWSDLKCFWKSLPPYKGKNAAFTGGLTGMIDKIMRLVPKNELHALLCSRIKESKRLRTFLFTLKSHNFHELCHSLQTNVVLQRHMYWAREAGIEVTFAIELISNLYLYLVYKLADIDKFFSY